MAQKLPPQLNATQSPCVRNCCLDAEDICIGCLRSIDEIVGWGSKSALEKAAILERCAARKRAKEQVHK
ncbi:MULTISPECIES: DUF1289 domain-containing protein [Pseudoalteromonas]|uniref:DUF1289 domain-containing protein n=1 Tax=Pseudoalteromonas TaxID=53246 RepID=UPI0009B86434|nr:MULTISPECIES: DUF1289 domain-containing protein [Pseudoalteromonas]MCG7549319.1 DUF1289 domain-containing protein [Pseudoalteromonas sp. Of7M-16]